MSTPHKFDDFIAVLDAWMLIRETNDSRLSKDADLSADYLNTIRKRRSVPKTSTLSKLAKALDTDLTSILPGAPMPDIDKQRRIDGSVGVADKGRDWGDPEPETHESPLYYQDWSGELSPVKFRRFLEPVITELFGEDVVSDLGDDFFTIHAEECVAQLEAWRESDPEASVTSHLALFLQSMLGGLNYAVNGVHQMKPFQSYAFQTARLLLQPPAPARKAK